MPAQDRPHVSERPDGAGGTIKEWTTPSGDHIDRDVVHTDAQGNVSEREHETITEREDGTTERNVDRVDSSGKVTSINEKGQGEPGEDRTTDRTERTFDPQTGTETERTEHIVEHPDGTEERTWDEKSTDSSGNVSESRGSSTEISPNEGGGYSRTDIITDPQTGETTMTTTTVDGKGDGTVHTTTYDKDGKTLTDETKDIKGEGKFGEDDDFSQAEGSGDSGATAKSDAGTEGTGGSKPSDFGIRDAGGGDSGRTPDHETSEGRGKA